MSKRKARQRKMAAAFEASRRKRKVVAVIALLLCLSMAVAILAQWRAIPATSGRNAMLATAPVVPVPSPGSPSKEYIYAGGRLIATEEPTALSTQSQTPTPTPSSSYSLTASASTISPGGSLAVNWTAPAGRPTTDWIALYKVGDPNTGFLWWHYTGGTTSGSLTLTAPGTSGQYEFRYLIDNSYTDVARSSTVTVGATNYTLAGSPSTVAAAGSLTVNWTAPVGHAGTDWIGLYKVGDPNTSFGWWSYTGTASSGSFTLTAPGQPGQYEFRYLLDNGYNAVTQSNVITVQ